MKYIKFLLVLVFNLGFSLAQPTPTTTVYQKLLEDVDTIPTVSAVVSNVGQSGHMLLAHFKDNPPNTCTVGGLAGIVDVRLEASWDNVTYFRLPNQITNVTFDAGGTLIWQEVFNGGSYPYVRARVSNSDTVNCLVDVYYSGNPGSQPAIRTIAALEIAGADNRSNDFSGRIFDDKGGAAGLEIYPLLFDGTTWDRLLDCEDTVAISVGAATTLELVALSASTSVRVCSLDVSLAAAGTVKLVSGTGANCVVGQADLTGAFTLGQGIPLHIGQNIGRALTGPDSEAVCLVTTGGGATAQGVLTYSQY